MAGEEDNDVIFKQHSANVRDAIGPKVGDKLWCFDENRRVYPSVGKGATRTITGGPIYSEHFVPHVILDETPLSWLLADGTRISKNRLTSAKRGGFSGYRWYTKQQMEDQIWVHHNRYAILKAAESASGSQLRAIAALIGYKAE